METLIGFAVGYLVGSQQGRDGLAKMRESVDAIRNSPEARKLALTAASVAGSAVKTVLSGGAGAVISGAVEALSRRAADTLSGLDDRRAA